MRSSNWSLWLVVGMFLAVLAFLAVVVRPARGDDFDAKVAQLRAKMAAKKADPFAGKNAAPGYTRTYLDGGLGAQSICDCGCIETGKCVCPNCCSPVKTRSIRQTSATGQPCGCPYCTCNRDSNCGSPLCPKLNRDPQTGNHGVPGLGVPAVPGNPWQWDDALAASNNGNGWWRYGTGNGTTTAPVAPQPTYYQQLVQQHYYQPARAFGGFRSFGGGCPSGG